jgi:Sec-independent protein translocase protein TatA
MSTCAPSSSGAGQKSSATMSTAETVDRMIKVLGKDKTEIKEDKNEKKEEVDPSSSEEDMLDLRESFTWDDALTNFPQAAKGIHAKKNITCDVNQTLPPETIEHMIKFLEEWKTEIKENKNEKKEDQRTESDATTYNQSGTLAFQQAKATYNQSGTRSSNLRGPKRKERDEKRLLAFQQANGR